MGDENEKKIENLEQQDYDSLAENLIESPSTLNEVLKREDIDLTTLYYTLETMHEDIMGDISEHFSKEDQKRDDIVKSLLYSIDSKILERENEELGAIYNVYGASMTGKQVMDLVRDSSEDELDYYDIIDVIRDNEEVRNLVFSKLIKLDPYGDPKYADYKKLLDEINDIRFKQEEEYSEMVQLEADEKARKEKEKREAEYQQYDNYEEEYEGQTPQEKEYEEYLTAIERCQQTQKEKYAKMAEKRKQTEKELLESMAYEESFRDASSEEIDALLEKEIKSKEARDAGFEVDEYGEIITPEKKTPEELESMSEEELQQTIANNEQTIVENNKAIKKALVERILSQQRIISDQQLEISRLNSQKKEL